MVVWHWMVGIGLGVLVSMFTIYKALPAPNSNRRRKTSFIENPATAVCPICLCEMENHNMAYLRCGHTLHDQCLKNLKKYSKICPKCRAAL